MRVRRGAGSVDGEGVQQLPQRLHYVPCTGGVHRLQYRRRRIEDAGEFGVSAYPVAENNILLVTSEVNKAVALAASLIEEQLDQ